MANNHPSISIYSELKNLIGEYNKLEISVMYSRGGINYWNGNHEVSGIRVHFKPVKVTNFHGTNLVSFTFAGSDIRTNGFKTLVLEATRYNKKKMEAIAQQVRDHAEALTSLYEQGKYNEMVSITQAFKVA